MLLVAGVLMLSACGTTSTVPISGRKHNLLVSDEEVLSLSTKEYTQYMASAKKSTNAANTAMVTRVGKKLANAVETYLKNNGMEADVKNYSWEFNLVADKQVLLCWVLWVLIRVLLKQPQLWQVSISHSRI